MPEYDIHSSVILFNHPEYGDRLLFKKGATNPRDQLGKNGVTVHGFFSSLFYNTIRIKAKIDGTGSTQSFNINRNSLIKYLGKDNGQALTDEELINALNDKFQTKKDENISQEFPGLGLRHAGERNQKSLGMQFMESLRASFLGWLYQTTISGMNRMLARLLFVRTEEDLLSTGELLAKKQYHDAYKEVPAYKTHVTLNGKPIEQPTFLSIPITDKKNYIKFQQYDSDTHRFGKYPNINKTDTSTGTTTGKPTEWVRGEQEIQTVKFSLKMAADMQFGNRRLSYINAFAFGPWATGLTTYELMRETGSVFATGPDKEKIIEKLLSIVKEEEHQLEKAVETFKVKHPKITAEDKTLIMKLINQTLRDLLEDGKTRLKDMLLKNFNAAGERAQVLMKQYQSELISLASTLNEEKQQIIIAGYPPFLKDIIEEVKKRKINFKDFGVVGVVGGQAISEAMRDQLVNDGFKQVYSSYGASDLDINLGVETEYEIAVRKAIEKNPDLARELYGKNKGLPMVFHYDPMNYHVECDKNDELIFTCTRTDRSSPRIRYDLGDKGRVYASSDVQALLAKYGIFQKPRTNLPLMFVWGRDSMVIFNGANLDFTELERAVTINEDLEANVLKKAFYKVDEETFEIWFELKEGVPLPSVQKMNEYAHTLYSDLVRLNQDFRYQVEKLDGKINLPKIRFFKRGESPISEAGGHRKQVLVFEKGVNLDKAYEFPDEMRCRDVTIPKSGLVLDPQKPLLP